jgi:hypothetical protein
VYEEGKMERKRGHYNKCQLSKNYEYGSTGKAEVVCMEALIR